MRTSTNLYPWDVVGDPAAAEDVAALGVDGVSLAAAYHAVRGVTPRHPRHRIVVAPDAATYFEPDESRWRHRRLKPAAAGWLDDHDSFASAVAELRTAGLGVSAWIVLAHNNHIGSAYPDACVTNAFGDRYPWALCVGQAEVGEYAATLVGEVVERFDIDAVELEGCGWYGFDHLSAHDKVHADELPAAVRSLLSLCFCATCRHRFEEAGLDVDRLRSLTATAIDDALARSGGRDGAAPPAEIDEYLGEGVAATVLSARLAAADDFRGAVVEAARRARETIFVWLDGQVSPAAVGANAGVELDRAFADVDGILLSLGNETLSSIEIAAGAARATDRRIGVVVDVLQSRHPSGEAVLVDDLEEARRSGVTDLHLYHAGLSAGRGRARLAELVERFGR